MGGASDLCWSEVAGELEGRGVVLRERRWIEDRGPHAHTVFVELAGGVPYVLGLEATFSREGLFHKIGKLVKPEIQTGDELFDRALFIDTTTPDRAADLLTSDGPRSAILELLSNVESLRIEGNTICVTLFGTMANDPPPVRDIRRDLAVLLGWMARYAVERGLPPAEVCLAQYDGSGHPVEPAHGWGL